MLTGVWILGTNVSSGSDRGVRVSILGTKCSGWRVFLCFVTDFLISLAWFYFFLISRLLFFVVASDLL